MRFISYKLYGLEKNFSKIFTYRRGRGDSCPDWLKLSESSAMSEKLKIEIREQNFFNARNCFLKILISIIDVKIKLRMKTKNYGAVLLIFPQNRFDDILNSQKPPVSVGVDRSNDAHFFSQIIF